MTKDIKIRKASAEDLKDILRLNLDLFKKEHREYSRSLNLKWTCAEGKKYFTERIRKGDGFVEVVDVGGRIIGYLCGGISKKNSCWIKAKYAELENMFIESGFRNKGIGAKLARNFINWCKDRNVSYIAVAAFVKNRQGVNFYKKLGFKEYIMTLEMVVKKN